MQKLNVQFPIRRGGTTNRPTRKLRRWMLYKLGKFLIVGCLPLSTICWNEKSNILFSSGALYYWGAYNEHQF